MAVLPLASEGSTSIANKIAAGLTFTAKVATVAQTAYKIGRYVAPVVRALL